jgi:hypothetical protein
VPLAKPVSPILQRGHPLARGLVYAWNFAEGGGKDVADGVAGINNATVIGTPSWVASPWGAALSFDGSTQYLKTNVNSGVDSPFVPFSISYTVYWASNPGGIVEVVSARNSAGASPGVFSQLTSSGQLNFGEYDGASFPNVVTSGLTAGNWYHVVGTNTGVAGSVADMALYINGAPNYSTSSGGLASLAASYPWCVASDNGTNTSFPGSVGNLFVWNRALSAAEVAQLYFDPFVMFRRRAEPQGNIFVVPAAAPLGWFAPELISPRAWF